MTSNQLSYWKQQEEKRSNLAKERETARHNVSDESIRSATNQINEYLGKENVKIKDRELLNDIVSLYVKEGATSFSALPDSIQKRLTDELKVNLTGYEYSTSDVISSIYKELKDIFGNVRFSMKGNLF